LTKLMVGSLSIILVSVLAGTAPGSMAWRGKLRAAAAGKPAYLRLGLRRVSA